MKNTIIIPAQNQKKYTVPTAQIAEIVDLGKATNLTLGGGSGGVETRNQPFGLLHRSETK